MSGLGAIAGGAGGTALGGPVGGVIGTTVGGVLDGMFNGDDPAEFWKQLDQNDYQSQKYYQWCQKFAPGIVASGDVWEAQAGAQSIDAFRSKWAMNFDRVRASGLAPYGSTQAQEFAAMDQGGFDANMLWHAPETMATESNGTTDNSSGSGGGKQYKDMSGFVMLWPWLDIWNKPSPVRWYHWALWLLMLITCLWLLRYMLMPRRGQRRRGTRRRARRMRRGRRSRSMR